MWQAGKPVAGYDLWGLQLLWWGRIGKVISFVSGATIILDAIGAERLQQFGKWTADQERVRQRLMFVGVPIVMVMQIQVLAGAGVDFLSSVWLYVLGALITGLIGVAIPALLVGIVRGLGRLFASRWEPVVYGLAAILLAVGFHFDILAS